MKRLVVYDSQFGNTERLARRIATILDARSLNVNEAVPADVEGLDLLVVGSPTQGGRPTRAVQDFLRGLPDHVLDGVRVAAFDTRVDGRAHGPFLRLLTGVIGYAAGRVGSSLKASGGDLSAPPEGFIVDGREGPLRPGEEQRAGEWAGGLASTPAGFNQ